MISLLKMAPEHSAKVFYEHREAAMCLPEKTHVLEKFRSGRSHGALAHECGVNESLGLQEPT